MKSVTQQDIARSLGVAQNTVSLALKDDPRLPEATRVRVVEEAKRLGYRPDPLVAALMERVRRGGRGRRARGVIACVLAGPKRNELAEHPSLVRALTGGRERAASLGFDWTEFWLADKPLRPERLATVLATRGIHGVLLHPAEGAAGIPELPWERYASAVLALLDRRIGGFHTSSIAPFRHVELALQQAAARGARSAGLALPVRYDRMLERLYTGAMASAGAFFPRLRVTPSHLPERWERRAFLAWWREHRPEVVLTRSTEPLTWLREAGVEVPADAACLHLGWHDGLGAEWAGVDPRAEAVGAAGVDLVAEQLLANERGLPQDPKMVLTAGRWVEGRSLGG